MPQFSIVDAPSNLGLFPSGVETLGIALKSAGLVTRLNASYGERVQPPPFSEIRDPQTHIRNGESIAAYSRQLADVLAPLIERGQFPIVLGGDCSILIGAMLGLKRIGNYGLFFVDAHADVYQAEAEPDGEVASMEMGIVTGRGSDILTNIDNRKPLVNDADVVVFGFRDGEESAENGSQSIKGMPIRSYDLQQAREPSFTAAAQQAVDYLTGRELDGFWIHLNTDVLDDAINPAVDYRLPGGFSFNEVSALLRMLLATGKAVGITVTIFNPTLDNDGTIAQKLTDCIVAGLTAEAPDQA